MAEIPKPVGITDIANEVTDPRRRLSMLAVILSKLEPCRKAQDMVGTSEGAAKEASAARYAAIGALLIWILRDSDLALGEIELVRGELKFAGRKQWIEMAERFPHQPKRPLLTTLLDRLDQLCLDIDKLHKMGGGERNAVLVTESKEFARRAAERIRNLDMPEEHKVIVFTEQTDELRPYEATAVEAGAELLCKILRESHMTSDECRYAKEVLVAQMTRDYLPKSQFLEKLIYTLDELKKR